MLKALKVRAFKKFRLIVAGKCAKNAKWGSLITLRVTILLAVIAKQFRLH